MEFGTPRQWDYIEYWEEKLWKDAKGIPAEYARLMRIFVRNNTFIIFKKD